MTITIKRKFSFQLGAALIVSMIMLLVVTAIGVAVMGGSHLELLMSNNSYFQTDAFRNAEIALKGGLNNLPTAFNTLSPDPNKIITWDNTSFGAPVTTPTGTSRYAVEYISRDKYNKIPLFYVSPTVTCPGPGGTEFCVDTFRIWGYGTDGKGAARLIRETFSRVISFDGIPSWHNITEIQ